MRILDPTQTPKWNNKISAFPDSTIFHTAEWARVLKESYGYQPVYIIEPQNGGGGLTSVLPLFHVASILTGRRGVALPFTDLCPPLGVGSEAFDRLFQRAVALGREKHWKTIEFRGLPGGHGSSPAPPSSRFLGHELDLNRPHAEIVANYRSSTRRNIKKAQNAGVTTEIRFTYAAVREFYRLNCITRRDHGLPPQPASFFKALSTNLIQKRIGAIVLGRHKGEAIAGAVFLKFNGKAIYKYGASDKKHQHLRANNLVMGEGIRWLTEEGCKTLHFGRTDRGHTGLRQFKNGYGTVEAPITYFKYEVTNNRFLEEKKEPKPSHNAFKKMPIPLLRLAGQLLYRHMG